MVTVSIVLDDRIEPTENKNQLRAEPDCDQCEYESPEERMTEDYSDYYWEYNCRLAKYRTIPYLDDDVKCPAWCPLLPSNAEVTGKPPCGAADAK